MRRYGLLIAILIVISACDYKGQESRKNNVSYREKVTELSVSSSVDCGTVRDQSDKEFRDCISTAFYSYQPFTAEYQSVVPFMFYSVYIYVYDGIDLYEVQHTSIDCAELTTEQCSFYYKVIKCNEPVYIELDMEYDGSSDPFICES